MKINEVADAGSNSQPDQAQLMGLVSFLSGRARDQAARKQISLDAFVDLARNLGISVNKADLPALVNLPPLSNVLEPIEPGATTINFKTAGEPDAPAEMPVNKAQDIVASAAKSAMKRGLKK
jgi:hypothetical protein